MNLPHFRRRTDLPEKTVIVPDRAYYPRPGTKPVGTFGINRRHVYGRGDCSEAHSRTEWLRRHYRVVPGAEPIEVRSWQHCNYGVYGDWQVEKYDKKPPPPGPRDYGDEDILRALWTLNRQAKRYRNRASQHCFDRDYRYATAAREAKEKVYSTKALVIPVLQRLGLVRLVGITDGEPTFAVFRSDGYCFHCPSGKWSAETRIPFSGQVEAKPQTSREMRLRDAWATVAGFRSRNPATEHDWEMACAAQLPARVRVRERYWDWEDDEEDDVDDWDGVEW